MATSKRAFVACLLCVFAACADSPGPINRVQTNLVEKSIFDGEWWYTSTSIDVDFDETFVFNSANAGAPFSGSMSTDYAIDYNRSGPSVLGEPAYSFPIARIRWVIDENYLYAYRAFELVSGGNPDGRSADFRGQPLAVFAIKDHVDVRKDYSATTGETTNVTLENTEDQRWYDRRFMRVDWSRNLLPDFSANDLESNELFTSFRRESVPFFVQAGSHPELSSTYQPQFVRVKDDVNYSRKNEWSKESQDLVHYMSFVTQEVWSPADGCLTQGGVCASVTATIRNAFLRIPDGHEYAAHTETNAEFDRFGLFRSHQPTYAAGAADRSVQRKPCTTDKDCGTGGACDTAARRTAECTAAGKKADCRTEENICVGGLTSDQGLTDFLSFYTSRLNFFENSLTDKTCVEDWECDGRYTECASGDADCLSNQLSECDPAARRCTTPLAKRTLKPVVFRLSPHFPPYLARQAFESVADWNAALMAGHRASRGLLPIDQAACSSNSGVCTTDLTKQARIKCQNSNPIGFCFCGSPEADDKSGTCRHDYDPFETPEAARARGIPNPYDCYVQGPGDIEHPETYTEYQNEQAYAYRFVGSECMLELAANSCDADANAPCEELGDIRHNFLTHLQHGGANFGGVAQPLSDPKNGELVTVSATMAAESIEVMGTNASQFFPVLRREKPEDSYFTGDNLRGYFAASGKVERPVTTVPVTSEGNTINDASRPGRTDTNAGNNSSNVVGDAMLARLDKALTKAKKLQGSEGRAAIKSDRLQKLRNSPIGQQLSASLAREFPNSKQTQLTSATAPTNVTQTATSFDDAQKELEKERKRRDALGARNMDVFDAPLYNSQYMQYYADRFKDRSLAEASLRMQQGYFKGVALHEIGHVLGLRHNFAGSLDRNNYHDGYFKIATTTPLPNSLDYDLKKNGGNEDGSTTGEEAERYSSDVRSAREERLQKGAGTVMTASIMDYNGDLSDFSGLGRYDRAAVSYSYFDKAEAYATADPLQPIDENSPVGLYNLERPDLFRRELWTYYRGGETCQQNIDCPHATGRESTVFQPVKQRCIVNPRLPEGSRSNCDDAGSCVCSNFYDDFDLYAAGSGGVQPEFAPVKYLFCHDNRTGDLSWCTRQDAGESFSEVIEHYRRSFRERYPRQYFRHFNAADPPKGSSYGSVVDAVKIYQHLFFRLNYEGNDFRQNVGPLGLSDQLSASATTLDWLAEIISAPDVGSYKLDVPNNLYRKVSDETNVSGADMSLPIGQGLYLWSQYQTGQNGFFRLERAGLFLDKLLAIQALTKRDWGLTYQVDEFFYVNFYDFFQEEIVDLFGGLISRNPHQYAPRYRTDLDGSIQYLSSLRRGTRGNQETTYPQPAIDGVDTETLRDFATIQALSEFPVYYDTSFEQRLLVFKLGSGDGYTIPDKRRDGSPTCRDGDAGCTKPDYIVYDSDRLHTSYVAVVIDPEETNKLDEQQVSYQLLKRLSNRQGTIRDLTAKANRSDDEQGQLDRAKSDLERDESFLEYLIELERQFGISSYFF
ncbi:MAG: hypothetical protein RL701_971 [Pseudomonadota bacterium]